MGVSISSENFSTDMGYGGFARFRMDVAKGVGEEFATHYKDLDDGMFLDGKSSQDFFEKYNQKTKEMIVNGYVTDAIANFCYQSDSEGKIDQIQAQQIYEVIKNAEDNMVYGYQAYEDCARMKHMKEMFKDCAENGGEIEWY